MVNLSPGCPFAPRCPLAAAVCEAEEPPLAQASTAGHLSACHFSARLDGLQPGDLFRPLARDAPLAQDAQS
jgi:hypothetical protein